MPRRRVLTEAQLEMLLALPTDEATLVRQWTLSPADLSLVDRRRRDHNRLGFALQLCALRYHGRLLHPGELILARALRFVAEQVGAEPDVLADYATRRQTRYRQLDALRHTFGFLYVTPGYRRDIRVWLLPVALATKSAATIAATLMDELRRRRLIAPGPFAIEQLVAAAMTQAERRVAHHLTRNLTRTQVEALDALLQTKEGTSMSVLARARQHPVRPGIARWRASSSSLLACARLASIRPAPKAFTRSGCVSLHARAAASLRSICGRCRLHVTTPLWSRPCSTPSHA
jgi:Domain of unknown function (DUF4158)